jgi:hypothetical protein
MPTIATLWAVVVIVLIPFVLLFAVVLAYVASRFEQDVNVDLRARLFRLTVSVNHRPDAGAKPGPSAPDHDIAPLRTS